jgi:hypothetical protein
VIPTRLGLLDRVPRIVRHLLIQLAAALLAWGASDLTPWLGQHGGVAAIAGALLGQLLLIVTPLVRSYGVGQDAPRQDGGYARAVWRPALLIVLALLAFALLSSSQAFARPAPAPAACPAGYWRADVRVPGQRIETGLDPVTHAERPEVVQNDPETPDRRYMAVSACVRRLTPAEYLDLFHQGSQP